MVEINKIKLFAWIETGYSDFQLLLAEFEVEQMTQPGVIGQWSIKDIMAHILVHEQRMQEWMKEILHGEQPTLFQPYAMPDDELDKLNEQIYQDYRCRLLKEIVQGLDKSHAGTLDLVETTTEENLFDTHCHQLVGGEPLWEAIAANTCWHYEEHAQDIRKWQIANRIK